MKVYDASSDDVTHLLRTLCGWRRSEHVISTESDLFVTLSNLRLREGERIHMSFEAIRK